MCNLSCRICDSIDNSKVIIIIVVMIIIVCIPNVYFVK